MPPSRSCFIRLVVLFVGAEEKMGAPERASRDVKLPQKDQPGGQAGEEKAKAAQEAGKAQQPPHKAEPQERKQDGAGVSDALVPGPGRHGLMAAVNEGNEAEVGRQLAERRAEVDMMDSGGATPLMLACHQGNPQLGERPHAAQTRGPHACVHLWAYRTPRAAQCNCCWTTTPR
jgi:hypothetical protein